MEACGGDERRADAALLLLFALRGTPSLTWGTEALLPGAKEPATRASMPWGRAGRRAGAIAGLQAARGHLPALRSAAGETWVDPTLAAWPENDFRRFVGDFGPEVVDEMLAAPFRRFASFARARSPRAAPAAHLRRTLSAAAPPRRPRHLQRGVHGHAHAHARALRAQGGPAGPAPGAAVGV
jgi:hypothetical protein